MGAFLPFCICLSEVSLTNSLTQTVMQDKICVPSGGDTLEKLTSHLLPSNEALFYFRGYVNFQNNVEVGV
jgi:hypothetical protein